MIDSASAICRELSATCGKPPVIGGVEIRHLIDAGGMGAVFQGIHLRLRIPVAVKFLFESMDGSAARFADEASTAAKINNPNVVRVYDVNKEGRLQYIVQEYVDGQTAEFHLEQSVRLQTPLKEDWVLRLIADTARGLAAIHAVNFLHLDIKPTNIMVSKKDSVSKILDLGLARQNVELPGTKNRIADGGTPGYASPEQLQFLKLGPSSDIYSLGVSMFELLGGRRAHDISSWGSAILKQTTVELPNIRRIRPDVSEATAAIIERCVRIDPEFRYQSALELLSELALATHAHVSRHAPVPFARPVKSPSGEHELAPLVYCVDDNVQVCMSMAELLTEAGYHTEVFTDGPRAIARMKKTPPDVVFLDYEMPVMSGLDVCRVMRGDDALKHIPVVFLTGSASPDHMKLAMHAGATDYLFKPTQAAELISRVGCLTKITRAQRELETLERQYGSFRSRLSTIIGKEIL